MLPGITGIGGFVGGAASITQTDSRTTAATSHSSVSFGAVASDVWVGVLAFHGDLPSNPSQTPVATIGGVSATRIVAHSTGDGIGAATGSALFVAQPGVASGTVAVDWSAGIPTTIVVFRTTGYNLGAAFATARDSANLSLNIPTLGLTVAASQNALGVGNTTWSNLTERGDETANSKVRSWAWDMAMAQQTGRTISPSPYAPQNGASTDIAASFSLI
jgi:hypothetical protein